MVKEADTQKLLAPHTLSTHVYLRLIDAGARSRKRFWVSEARLSPLISPRSVPEWLERSTAIAIAKLSAGAKHGSTSTRG